MRWLDAFTRFLVIVGGLNWLLVGIANFDLVAAIFGAGSGLTRLVYVLVGISAIYQFIPLMSLISDGGRVEPRRVP